MKTAFINGKVYIGSGKFCQAFLSENGIITRTGKDEEILSDSNIGQVIDCEKRTVLPGLNDSHMHLVMTGEYRDQLLLNDCHSPEEIIGKCRAYLQSHPDAAQKGLHAAGWNQDSFTGEKRVLYRHDVDQIAENIPIVLERICGHIVAANSKAIEMLGISGNTPQPSDGVYEIGNDGEPDGIFKENAVQKPLALIPPFSPEQRKKQIANAMNHAAECGVTSVQSNDTPFDAKKHAELFELIHALYTEGKAPVRYRVQVCFRTPEEFETACREGEYSGIFPEIKDQFEIGPLKLFKDGSLGARTALMSHEYADDPGNFGVESLDSTTMDEYCRIAAEYHVQTVTHAIGDEAIRRVTASYEKAFISGKNIYRNSIIHCQITDPELIQRIAKSGILVQYQPLFLNADLHTAEARVGKRLASSSYAFQSLTKAGGKISYGTDSPVEDLNPFPNICCAVTRQDFQGFPSGGFYPDEKVDVFTAIDAYTQGSAFCEFAENRKGMIREGFLADAVMLDRDIFSIQPEEIKEIKPVLTMTGGKIVFSQLANHPAL